MNDRPYSDGNLGDLFWSFADMISYASRGTEVRPGDIIGSGTVGTGCVRHSRGWRPASDQGSDCRVGGSSWGVVRWAVRDWPD